MSRDINQLHLRAFMASSRVKFAFTLSAEYGLHTFLSTVSSYNPFFLTNAESIKNSMCIKNGEGLLKG